MADKRPPKDTEDAALSERLKNLGDRLSTLAPKIAGRDDDGDPVQAPGSGSNLARAMRLSSEFVAGILVGCFIGWLIDFVLTLRMRPTPVRLRMLQGRLARRHYILIRR